MHKTLGILALRFIPPLVPNFLELSPSLTLILIESSTADCGIHQ
jgi:hypothetical protein